MRGYPIGTFLFWFIRGEDKNNYTFYKFIQEYHERDNSLNEVAPKPELRDEIIGVLDGQQRLGSMYLALQGSYRYKRPHGRWTDDSAFPKRNLYLNLLRRDTRTEDDEDFIYEFKFLTSEEAADWDQNHLWFSVRTVLHWGQDPRIDDYYDHLLDRTDLTAQLKASIKGRRDLVKRLLRTLHQRLVLEELISYSRIEEQDLDNILAIFVRVNSGGTVLSKSDLLFSTIVANWQRARDEIESLQESINKKGDGFSFSNDFIMRACLVLTDSPVRFQVKSFKKDNIDAIMKQWDNIKAAIETTVDVIAKFGFSRENLTSLNAVIPIAYYVMKGGNVDEHAKAEIKKYLIHALVKQTFGGQSDQVLSDIRDAMRNSDPSGFSLTQRTFDFNQILNSKLPANKTFAVTETDVETILEYPKGAYSFMVLSLLYPNLKFGAIKFHQDHIHPASVFTQAKLMREGLTAEKAREWISRYNQLPNLQLMEGTENKSKNDTPFKEWLYGRDANGNPNVSEVNSFLNGNYIPTGVSLEMKDFDAFFWARRDLLREKISTALL